MDSSAVNDLEIELQTCREKLNMYKGLNQDLSNRIQELKVELRETNRELTTTKQELLEARTKTSELERYFRTMNTHCMNFFNIFHSHTQRFVESGLINGLVNMNHDNDRTLTPQQQQVVQRNNNAGTATSIRNRLLEASIPSPAESNSPENCLNTITEESRSYVSISTPGPRSILKKLPVTSTPFVPINARRNTLLVVRSESDYSITSEVNEIENFTRNNDFSEITNVNSQDDLPNVMKATDDGNNNDSSQQAFEDNEEESTLQNENSNLSQQTLQLNHDEITQRNEEDSQHVDEQSTTLVNQEPIKDEEVEVQESVLRQLDVHLTRLSEDEINKYTWRTTEKAGSSSKLNVANNETESDVSEASETLKKKTKKTRKSRKRPSSEKSVEDEPRPRRKARPEFALTERRINIKLRNDKN